MRIAHVGPALARRGGPAGYLLQLSLAAERYGKTSRHQLTFPPADVPARVAPPTLRERARAALRPIKRALVGAPAFYRPKAEDLRRSGGAIDALLTASMQTVCAEARESIEAALRSTADVLVAHGAGVAERLLDARRPGQQVWLAMHAPMPLGLDLTWSWGIPEWEWDEILPLPDVGHWIRWEIGICSAVDRLITPCPEAVAELARADRRFAQLPFDYVLTGGEGRERRFPGEPRARLRARWGLPEGTPVGLFLSSPLPYRGLDVLLEAIATVPPSIPGVVAIAGSSRGVPPAHPRVHHLGLVRDVSDLLHAVDFVVNVNRFSLFDLSTIEAAEAGRAMLLHATGGNIRFQALGVGAVMLDDLRTATVARGLEHCFAMAGDCRAALGRASRRCYDEYLTLEHLWREHIALYDRSSAGGYARTQA
jgi:glycosyltransferase involved in cell wall biosynthesis